MTLTQDRLKELLHYDPDTGHFTRRVKRGHAIVGSRAGTTDRRGYRQIMVDWCRHSEHRLAFLYMTGEFPADEVDHKNRVRVDNRWSNLRPASRRDNAGNKKLQSNSTSGHRGVTWDRSREKWKAQGRNGGRRTHLGYFDSLGEAAAAAQAGREVTYGKFA